MTSMPKKKAAMAARARRTTYAERVAQAGVTMIVLTAAYQAAKYFGAFSFSAVTEGTLGVGAIFFIGLTASVSSCLAMVGGLLLSVSASWDKAHPKATRWEKFEPQIYFNIGRIVGYFILGGLTGLLGKQLILSVQGTGILKIVLSLVMIWLGLGILDLVPKKYCSMPLPAFAVRRMRRMHESESIFAPFLLGGFTYFIPCGFTQSMQLLALSTGSFNSGALIMTVFALGTLPALLGIGTLSAVTQGKAGKIFLSVAGAASLLLGLGGLRAGIGLSGITLPAVFRTAHMTGDPNVVIDGNGQQIISVQVGPRGYNVGSFTIDPGKPTWIYATVSEALSGCLSSLTVPSFNISSPLTKGENWIGPLRPERDFSFMCSAGMFRADVRVRS